MQTLIVDGYNIIHAWPALHTTLRERGLEDARRQLVSALTEYAAQTGVSVTVVFDAHARPGAIPSTEQFDGVTVLFGSRRATADHVIERAAYRASQRGEGADVVVATDDRLERDVVGAMGVATMGARALEAEVARVAGGVGDKTKRMREDSRRSSRLENGLDPEVRRRLERLRRGEED
ncbi:MAG TPA: NYN domain-containing protein [Candidatus Saccharimonadales bacterium]|nr:NYN domain-containing protein [Candidatus Saccharimonadales bacterium]